MVGMDVVRLYQGWDRERLGAGIYFLAWIASLVVQENVGFRGLPIGMFLIDAAVLVALAAIAWRAPQSWPTWASGPAAVTVMAT
jgi:hypothetical protein